MNQAGHLIRKSDIIAYGIKMKLGLAKSGDFSSIPVHQIPIEKGEPLALELAHFIESVSAARQPKVGAALGKSALEVAIAITEQIAAVWRDASMPRCYNSLFPMKILASLCPAVLSLVSFPRPWRRGRLPPSPSWARPWRLTPLPFLVLVPHDPPLSLRRDPGRHHDEPRSGECGRLASPATASPPTAG